MTGDDFVPYPGCFRQDPEDLDVLGSLAQLNMLLLADNQALRGRVVFLDTELKKRGGPGGHFRYDA